MSNRTAACVLCPALLVLASCAAEPVVWRIDNLQRIGGHEVAVVGDPKVVDTPAGGAVEFDGVDDALFVPVHPMAGWRTFTLELLFRPDAWGLAEQRFFHLSQQDPATGEDTQVRVLFETRLPGDGTWYLDTFIHSAAGRQAMMDPANSHPVGKWYHVALVHDGREMRHYVNGVKEMSAKVGFAPQGPGHTSIGVRINKVYWFKGAIRWARFTPRALSPKEFELRPGG